MHARPADRIELQIEKIVPTGLGLAREQGRIVFVEGAYPGDRVLAELLELKPDYARARVVSLLEAGPARCPSPCALFDRCGGCDWLDLSDAEQHGLARAMAEEALSRVLRQERIDLLGPTPSPQRLAYRRRTQLKVAPDGRIGYYRRGSREVVSVAKCPVLVPDLQRLLGPVTELAPQLPGLREVHLLAGDGHAAVRLLARAPLSLPPAEAAARLEPYGVRTVLYSDGTGRRWGRGVATIRIGRFRYEAPVQSFFQGNAAFDEVLIRRVTDATLGAGTDGPVLELYAGAGLFTLPIAERAGSVVSVELDDAACTALRHNLEAAGLRATVLNRDAASLGPRMASLRPQAVLADPPRSGLDRAVRKALLDCSAERIVILSCDLGTLARDLGALQPSWCVRRIELLDLFPQTAHLEALALLERRAPP
jgi:23S rRNA (uracil1939-C5)-methyltransferase